MSAPGETRPGSIAPSGPCAKAASPTSSPVVKCPSAASMALRAWASFVSPAGMGSSIDPDTSSRNSTLARLRTSRERRLHGRDDVGGGKRDERAALCALELADLLDALVERAVEVAVAGGAYGRLALRGAREADEVGCGLGLDRIDPLAGETHHRVVGGVVAVGRVDGHELLGRRLALACG